MAAADDRPLGDTPRDRAVLFVAVAVVAFFAHVRSLGGPFVWDDRPLIVQSAAVRRLDSIPGFFAGRPLPVHGMLGYHIYRPVRESYLALMHAAFGNNARAFHFGSLLLHALNAALFCALVNALFRNRPLAAVAGFLFAVHPVHVEAVSWIKNAGELLALALALASFLLYSAWVRMPLGKGGRARTIGWYALSLVAFGLGLLAKESAITLPLLLLAAAALGVWRARRKAALGAVPFLLAAAVCGLCQYLYIVAQQRAGGEISAGAGALAGRLVLAARTTGACLRLLAFPSPLNPWHTFASEGALSGPVVGALGILGILLLAGIWRLVPRLRDETALVFGLFWTLLALAPVSNLILVNPGRPVAEQRLYTPSAGWCLFLGAVVFVAVSRGGLKQRRTAGMVCGALIVLMLAMTSNYTDVWRGRLSLWTTAVSRSPRVAQARANLGRAYFEARRPAQAAAQFLQAGMLMPDDARLHSDLGAACEAMGRLDDAAAAYRRAIALKPVYPHALRHLVRILVGRGELDEAQRVTREMLARDPDYVDIQRVHAGVLRRRGRFDEALAMYEKIVAADPRDALSLVHAGDIHRARGDTARAMEFHRRAITVAPCSAEAHHALGVDLAEAKRFDEAIGAFRRALAADPARVVSRRHLARLLFLRGEMQAALREYRPCLSLARAAKVPRGEMILIHQGLEGVLRALGRNDAADEQHRAAEALKRAESPGG